LAAGRLDELLAEAAHNGRLAAILLAAPASERLAMIAQDARYRSPSLARLLALGGEERLDAAPAETEEYAGLALAVSLALPRKATAARRLRASCAWLLGTAQLRTGKLDAAETSFISIYRHGGVDGAEERALAGAGLAQVRWQQRRPADAWALLAVASSVFADRQDAAAVCACRSLCGFLLLSNGERELARLELRAARQLLECSRAPSLDVLLCLALAHCEVARGGPAAPDFLMLARDASRSCMAPAVLALGAWWEAVIGLGADADEAQVDEARQRALAAGGRRPEAAVPGRDLGRWPAAHARGRHRGPRSRARRPHRLRTARGRHHRGPVAGLAHRARRDCAARPRWRTWHGRGAAGAPAGRSPRTRRRRSARGQLEAGMIGAGRGHCATGAIQAMAGSARAGASLANAIAGLPVDKVRAAAAAAAAADPCLRDPLVATMLLLCADQALDDPCFAERLGEAAFVLLSVLDADPEAGNSAWLLTALATILRSRLAQGRLPGAEEAYRHALPFLAAAPGIDGGRATLLAGLAQLRWAQRRLDEAAALFLHAARDFGEMRQRQAEAACRGQAGFVLLEQGDVAGASTELALAHLNLNHELAPALAARIAWVLAWANLALGRAGEAREQLHAARSLYGQTPEAAEQTVRAWWEARIAALDGEIDRADSQLDAVRHRLLAEGSLGEAARATLDLLDLRVTTGRLDALAPLGHDLIAAFGHHLVSFKPGTMIDLLASCALQRSSAYRPALYACRQYLSGFRHRGGRADFIPAVQRLADPLLMILRRGLALPEDLEPLAPTETEP
jgi:hypothetical protein